MFEQTFVTAGRNTRKPWTVAVSFVGQIALVGVALLLPLLRTAVISSRIQVATYAPLPPTTRVEVKTIPQHAAASTTRPVLRVFDRSALQAPTRIPSKVAMITDAPAIPGMIVSNDGSSGGGVLGEILTANTLPVPAPPVVKSPQGKPKPQAPVRVGGDVQASKIQNQARPVYPPLAKAARISGIVKLQAVIGRDGTIRNLQVVSGHPLLVAAALSAVQQWTYSPTLLNGEPVEVITQIEVHFTLAN